METFKAVVHQRRASGTPHLTNNSYGFMYLPLGAEQPNHEAYDLEHPLNRKVREVIASGCLCFFAAGNYRSISAMNSLPETLTIAAVNSGHERIGYSAQGPGTLHGTKPDLLAYSHFSGNMGPWRPTGGTGFDTGTSAACPVAAGVATLLLSAIPNQPGWDAEMGHGVVNADAAYHLLRTLVCALVATGDDPGRPCTETSWRARPGRPEVRLRNGW